ncbi:1-acyl-sn-glycerol-3-phosphate acyltransferase [Pelagibacteraceae bacterium]|nr:1-acyl-sn-glycerol-3-phosphate acyltransferase [Pelagibacteraceae bacterium]
MNKIDFSYASKIEHNFTQRLIIKTIEKITGKNKLEKIYQDFSKDNPNPRFFWSGILKFMNINVINKSKKPLKIPSVGPLIIIANHPFGIIDGLILCSLASKVRSDFKILTHETLNLLPELDQFILPIEFNEGNKETIKNNINTGKKGKDHLLNEGLLIIFPSGGVTVAKNPKTAMIKDNWKHFTAKLIQQTKADVLPIYFDGSNGLLFHLFAAKLKNQTLKYSSYIHETRKKIGKEIIIYSGDIIKYIEMSEISDRSSLTEFLKTRTYNLINE